MSLIEILSTAFLRVRQDLARCGTGLSVLLLTACAVQPPLPSEPAASADAAVTAPAADAEIEVAQEEPVPATPDRVETLQNWVDRQNRVYAIAAPLLIENTELCPRHARPLLGFTAKNRFSYSGRFGDVARAALGLGERLRVMNVLPGSGAAQAGLKKGDTLVALDGKSLPQGPRAERDTAMMVAAAMRGRNSLNLTVLRDGQRTSLRIPFTHACAFGIELGNGSHVNSYADGYRVLVTSGMVDFARSDQELAYVLAKEIAHNIVAPAPRPDLGAAIDALRQVGLEPVPGGLASHLTRRCWMRQPTRSRSICWCVPVIRSSKWCRSGSAWPVAIRKASPMVILPSIPRLRIARP